GPRADLRRGERLRPDHHAGVRGRAAVLTQAGAGSLPAPTAGPPRWRAGVSHPPPHGRSAMSAAPTPVVELTGITITFPGVKALDAVDFRLFPGEVHALMGENGPGKSTLIKALTGDYGIDAGRVVVAGH